MIIEEGTGKVTLEGVQIVYRNFSGVETQYNRAGMRNFAVVLNDEDAAVLKNLGWNVKTKPSSREEGTFFNTLPVVVNFDKGRPPRVVLVGSRGRTPLNAETVCLVDEVDLQFCDVILRPYDWNVNGTSGRKAYLQTLFAIILEDYLELKYIDVPEIGAAPAMPALEQNYDNGLVLQGEIVDDPWATAGPTPY